MLNFNSIHAKIIRRMHCTSDEAWTGISNAYLTVNHDSTEREQAWYLYDIGCKRVLDLWLSNAALDYGIRLTAKRLMRLKQLNGDDNITVDDLFIAPAPIKSDIDFIIETISNVPDSYRIPVTVVITELLKNDERKRKPLTVEMTRQYLKRAHVPNTSEMARQVYTYLTTLNK